MGIDYVPHPPGYAAIWTEDRIRADLRQYLADRDEWPSRGEFERDGRTALRNAVNRTGGADPWAAEFGLPRANRLSGVRRGWTHELIEVELRKLVGDANQWPSTRAFRSAGLGSMLTSIYSHEGPAYWADRLNLELVQAPARRRRPEWTDERIRSELEQFCAGRDQWPTEREFIEAGKRNLYDAASRHGGLPAWADRLELPRRRVRNSLNRTARPDGPAVCANEPLDSRQ